jgi:hypothetical protein
MELISFGRILLARRLLVAVGLVFAIAAGVFVSYRVSLGVPPTLHSRQYYVGEGSAQVLIDTPKSQIADLNTANPTAAALLYTRATLLANLMATAPVQQEIAAQVGIPVNQLSVTPPLGSVVPPIKATPLAVAGKAVEAPTGRWQLSIAVDPTLPIIAFSTEAPTSQHAEQLATAAVTVLSRHVNAIINGQHIPSYQQAVLNPIGPPQAVAVARGPRKVYGLAAAVILFFLISFGIVAASGRARRRKDESYPQDQGYPDAQGYTDADWYPDEGVTGVSSLPAGEPPAWLDDELELTDDERDRQLVDATDEETADTQLLASMLADERQERSLFDRPPVLARMRRGPRQP